jgi:hypothetical protein
VSSVKTVLLAVSSALSGAEKPTPEIRSVMLALSKDQIPSSWRRLCSQPLSVSGWVADLCSRLAQLHRICSRDAGKMFDFSTSQSAVSLGCLFFPEAFVAGTRQSVSQQSGVSLDLLEMHISVDESSSANAVDSSSFLFTDLTLLGSAWTNGSISAFGDIGSPLPTLRMHWRARDVKPADLIAVPVYHDRTRAEYLFSIELPVDKSTSVDSLVQRGVAIAAWAPVSA